MSESVQRLTLEFLAWIAAKPRTYGESMEAWRSHCPRFPVWEDAIKDGLIQREPGATMKDAKIVLTPLGRAMLEKQTAAGIRRAADK